MRSFACLLLPLAVWAGDAPAPAPDPTPAANPLIAPPPNETAIIPKLGIEISPPGFDVKKGFPIRRVEPGSTAAALLMVPGDVIISINNQTPASMEELRALMSGLEPGADVRISIRRGINEIFVSGKIRVSPTPAINDQGEAARLAREIADKRFRLHQQATSEADLGQAMLALNKTLQELPARLNEAAKGFKEIYPDGEFVIAVEIRLTSKKGAVAIDLSPKPPEEAPVKDTPPQPEKAGLPGPNPKKQ